MRGRREGSGDGTIEHQHGGLCPVHDVPVIDGDVQHVFSLREKHPVVPLICVDSRLRVAPAHRQHSQLMGRVY